VCLLFSFTWSWLSLPSWEGCCQKLSATRNIPVYPHIRPLKIGNRFAASPTWSMKLEHSTRSRYTVSLPSAGFRDLCNVTLLKPTAFGRFLYSIRAPERETKSVKFSQSIVHAIFSSFNYFALSHNMHPCPVQPISFKFFTIVAF
jgi:hypothetical protein